MPRPNKPPKPANFNRGNPTSKIMHQLRKELEQTLPEQQEPKIIRSMPFVKGQQ